MIIILLYCCKMLYSDLLKKKTSAFYLRVLVSNFLRIPVPEARKMVDSLENTADCVFVEVLKNEHSKYIKKDKPYKSIYNNHKANLTKVLSQFNITNVDSYLDFGCGDGMKLKIISDILKVTNKYGLDINATDENYKYDGVTLPNRTYDLITCFQVLHHICPKNILQQLINSLSPGGYFLLKEHDFFSEWIKTLIDLQHVLFTIDTTVEYPILTYNSQEEWIKVFEKLGMELVSTYVENPTCKMHFYALFRKKI